MKYKLGEICNIVSGSTPKTNVPEYWGGNLKWVTPAELSDDSYIVTDTSRKITELGANNAGLTSFPSGTILLSSRAPIGKVAIAGCEMFCNQGFKNLICSNKIYNKYLFWFLKSKTDYLNSLGRGSTFKEISKQIVSDIVINLPEFEEQEKISNIFEEITNLISLRNQQLEQLDLLIKSRFVEMFGDPRLNPNNYEVFNFEDITEIITDGEHITPKRVEKGIYLLSARNVLNHCLILEDVDYIDESEFNRIAKRVTPKFGDILISCSGTIGRCCTVPNNLKFQMVRSVALLRFKDFINPVFIEYLITSNYLQEQIINSATKSSQANLFQGKIKKLCGYIPPLALQNQFADFVTEVEKQKSTVKQSLEQLETLKKKLMQDYFG